MVGEQIGFDEGGVLEALRDPVYTHTETKYRHNKAGLVTSEITTVVNVTGAHIVAASLGPALLALFVGIRNLEEEITKEDIGILLAGTPFGLGGMALAAFTALGSDDDPFTDNTNTIIGWIEKLTGYRVRTV